MDANSHGTLLHHTCVQRLIRMIMLLWRVMGLFVVSALFTLSSPAHAIGAAVASFLAETDFTGGTTVVSTMSFSNVAANNSVGVSPDAHEVSVTST